MIYDKYKLLKDSPGTNLIPKILAGDIHVFIEFYNKRVKTFSTPQISHRMFSYSIFSDLILQLKSTESGLVLPTLIEIALTEKPQYLSCALSLINDLDTGYFTSKYKELMKSKLKLLYVKVAKYNPYYDYTHDWNRISINFFLPDERAGYTLKHLHYSKVLPQTYRYVDSLGVNSDPDCSITANKILIEMEQEADCEELKGTTLSFIRNFSYSNYNFWLYKTENPNVCGFLNRGIYTVQHKGEMSYKVFIYHPKTDTDFSLQDIVADFIYVHADYDS